jgi:septal ring factor EnvC (AmiA/AmiB activator)
MSNDNVSLRELLRVEFALVRAELQASLDMSKLAYKSLEKDIHLTHKKQDQTNGKVQRLEKEMKEVQAIQAACPVNYMQEKDKEHDKLIDILSKETEVLRFFANRPKLFKIMFAVMVGTTLFSLFIAFVAISEKIIPFIVEFIK